MFSPVFNFRPNQISPVCLLTHLECSAAPAFISNITIYSVWCHTLILLSWEWATLSNMHTHARRMDGFHACWLFNNFPLPLTHRFPIKDPAGVPQHTNTQQWNPQFLKEIFDTNLLKVSSGSFWQVRGSRREDTDGLLRISLYPGGRRGEATSCSTRPRTNLHGSILLWSSLWQKWEARQRGARPTARPTFEVGHTTSVHRAVFPAPGPPVTSTPGGCPGTERVSRQRRSLPRAHSRQ